MESSAPRVIALWRLAFALNDDVTHDPAGPPF
jgi:hypothetical protein